MAVNKKPTSRKGNLKLDAVIWCNWPLCVQACAQPCALAGCSPGGKKPFQTGCAAMMVRTLSMGTCRGRQGSETYAA